MTSEPVSDAQSEPVSAIQHTSIWRYQLAKGFIHKVDVVCGEEPLELWLEAGDSRSRINLTMRSAGQDIAWALGFLYAEGIIRQPSDVLGYNQPQANLVVVQLQPDLLPDISGLARYFAASSACGVCGRHSLEILGLSCPPLPHTAPIAPELILSLPPLLRQAQQAFPLHGGSHASAFFGLDGQLHYLSEDIGRHNALDKVLGQLWLAQALPAHCGILLSSSRISYELVQKTIRAGVPVLCGLSAASSLAIELASAFGLTLIGFLKDHSFNVYSGPERLQNLPPS